MGDQLQPWKQVRSKRILSHSQLEVNEDVVRLPNGKENKYVLHAPTKLHSVIIIAINNKKQVLVQKEYSYPPNEIMWQLPGGKIEKGETVEKGALRELAEESGYSAKKTKVIGSFFVHNRLSDRRQYIVVCTQLFKHTLPGDADEFIENHWLTRAALQKMIQSKEIENINMLAAINVWLHHKASA